MTNRYLLCASFSTFQLILRSSEETKLQSFQRQFPLCPPFFFSWHDFIPVIDAGVDKLKNPSRSLGGDSDRGFAMCLQR